MENLLNLFFLYILLFSVAKRLYKSKCPSVCQPRLGENVIFSAPPIFVQILLTNEHLFCKYFVRLSVGNAKKAFATYGCFHPCFLYQSILAAIQLSNSFHIHLFNSTPIYLFMCIPIYCSRYIYPIYIYPIIHESNF